MNSALSIAARLKEERNRLKLSQEKLAAAAGVTRQSQSKYEKGLRHPDSIYLHAIAQSQCDVNYILTGQRINSSSQNSQHHLQINIADAPAHYVKHQHQDYDNPKTVMEANDYIFIPNTVGTKSTRSTSASLIFTASWLSQNIKCSTKSLSLMTIDDDGMEPSIGAGDIALLSHDDKLMQQDGLFIIKMNGVFVIKRCQHLPNHQIKISSDNPAYDTFHLTVSQTQKNKQIIGKIVWIGHKL
jgi:phage repressor protein C with HTH and peptisase S24 domain